MDPERFFQDVFGGERFSGLIGMPSVGRTFGNAMYSPGTRDNQAKFRADDDATKKRERVNTLAEGLKFKLDSYVFDDDLAERKEKWKARCKLEYNELESAPFGIEILRVKAPCEYWQADDRPSDLFTG